MFSPSIKPLLLDNRKAVEEEESEELLKIKLLTSREYEVLTLIAEGAEQ